MSSLVLRSLAVVATLLTTAPACRTVELSGPVDGGTQCKEGAYVPCNTSAPGRPGCYGDPAGASAALPLDAGFPEGCVGYVIGVRRGDCAVLSHCVCQAGDVPDAGLQWSCE